MANPMRGTAKIRCAVYTRKSTEEGLEQAFNSLDAQREACAAYVMSQLHEGWALNPEIYDDGGYSGGNTDRPGLRQLLADVKAKKVDVIVVYKVDRLTRSLADFAKIVEILDVEGASFVSVTQAFNTTSSMGRLTLNVLLSFAQFEREVTAERIRDKVAASKRKGIWMGGPAPLGYVVGNRRLEIDADEGERVRLIFERYIALGSIRDLAQELVDRDIRSKVRHFKDGRTVGGSHFSPGALAHLLKNPLYVGDVPHKGEIFKGEHEAIVDRATWDRVQKLIAENRNAVKMGSRAISPSPLAGLLTDSEGRAMMPDHTVKGSRRYRYYVTRPERNGLRPADGWRIPAGDIEKLILDRLARYLTDRATLVGVLGENGNASIISEASALGARLALMPPDELRRLFMTAQLQVGIGTDRLAISLALGGLVEFIGHDIVAGQRIALTVMAKLTRRGQELRLAYPPNEREISGRPDAKLIELMAKAGQAYQMLISEGESIDPVRKAHLTRIARLKFLAPDIVTNIIEGRQPASLTSRHLIRASNIPVDWEHQREELGFI